MQITYGFKEASCCVLTMPGLLKVLETFMAGFIFTCIINTSLYLVSRPWSAVWPRSPSASSQQPWASC